MTDFCRRFRGVPMAPSLIAFQVRYWCALSAGAIGIAVIFLAVGSVLALAARPPLASVFAGFGAVAVFVGAIAALRWA